MATTTDAITEVPLGWAPFQLEQVEYRLQGSDRVLDYEGLVAALATGRSARLERQAQVQAAFVRQRNEVIESLGEVLAEVCDCLATLGQKDDAPEKISSSRLGQCHVLLGQLGVKSYISYSDGVGTLDKGNAQKQQSELQYAIDMRDNDLQQDVIAMQSLMNKRDDAYALAAKLASRISDARSKTLENLR